MRRQFGSKSSRHEQIESTPRECDTNCECEMDGNRCSMCKNWIDCIVIGFDSQFYSINCIRFAHVYNFQFSVLISIQYISTLVLLCKTCESTQILNLNIFIRLEHLRSGSCWCRQFNSVSHCCLDPHAFPCAGSARCERWKFHRLFFPSSQHDQHFQVSMKWWKLIANHHRLALESSV